MPRKRMLTIIAAGILALAFGGFWLMDGASSSGSILTGGNTYTATIEGTEIDVAFKIPGKLAKVYIEEGDQVKPGQLLAELESKELAAQLEQARGAYQAAVAKVAQAEAAVKATREGAWAQLSKAQSGYAAKADANRKNVAMAKAALDAAQTAYDIAKANWQRVQELYREGAVPKSKYEEAQMAYAKAEAELARARETFNLASGTAGQKEVEAAADDVALAQANLEQINLREKDVQAAKAAVEQARGALNAAQAMYENRMLYAPAGGIVLTRNMEAGEMVAAGLPFATLVDLDDLFIKIYVTEDKLASLSTGKEVTVEIPALNNAVYKGKIVNISAAADFAVKKATSELGQTDIRSFAVKIKLVNRDHKLRPGLTAKIRL